MPELNDNEQETIDYIAQVVYDLEGKLKSTRYIAIGSLILGAGAGILAFTTSKAVVKVAQGMFTLNQNMEVVMAAKAPRTTMSPSTQRYDNNTGDLNGNGPIDETRKPPDNEVLDPFEGPASEASDAVRQSIEDDPMQPSMFLKEPGVE